MSLAGIDVVVAFQMMMLAVHAPATCITNLHYTHDTLLQIHSAICTMRLVSDEPDFGSRRRGQGHRGGRDRLLGPCYWGGAEARVAKVSGPK